MRALPLLVTLGLALCASCVPARIDPVNGISVEGIVKALGVSPSPSPAVQEVDEFGRPVSPSPSRTPSLN